MADRTELSATEAVKAISEGSLSSREYAEGLAARVERFDETLNVFLHFDRVAVNDAAADCQGRLGGLPVAVKDNIVTVDAPTTCASKILTNFRSPFDATAVARLKKTGAYVFGKTNLDEFAMGSSTENSAFGVTRNPWDPSRVAGGSSGGSAAAVAARMVPVALGSETGGSVRQPAAFCGVVGMKPTYGRISRSGLVAFASSLDQIGIFTRTVEDCALVLEVVAGHDPADSTSSDVEVGSYRDAIGEGVAGLRIGVIAEAMEMLTGEMRENFERCLTLLRSGGAHVDTTSIETVKRAIAVYYVVANAEASANLARFDGIRYGHRTPNGSNLKATYTMSRTEGFGDEVKRRIMLGTFALSSGYYDAYYGRAQAVRAMMRDDFEKAFASFDLLVTPTTPSPAFRVGEKASDPLEMYLSDIFTAPANLVGIPAIAVPSGLSSERLPLSLQIMAKHFDEATMFRAAKFIESQIAPLGEPSGLR